MSLNDRQKLFCLEYLKDLNATQAAIRAGYSKRSANNIGPDNLLKPIIQAEIQKLNKERFNKVGKEGERVISELVAIGHSDITDYVDIEEGGGAYAKTPDQWPENAGKAVSSIKQKRVIKQTKDKSEDIILDDTFEFKLWDKNRALENLGRHHGLFTDKKEHTHKFEDMTDEELKSRLADLIGKAGGS